MKLQRSRFRLLLLLLLAAFLAVLFFGTRQAGLLPELPTLPLPSETVVPDETPAPEGLLSPEAEPSVTPADPTPASESFDLYGL